MKRLSVLFGGLMALTALDDSYAQAAAASTAGDEGKRVVVLELYQSQGCSSCPPAQDNLNAVAGQPGVLALSYAVTYWDELGWKDTFGQQAFTDRQWDYAKRHDRDGVFTPQIVINGSRDIVGTRRGEVDAAIASAASVPPPAAAPAVHWQAGRLSLGSAAARGDYDVWLVRYDPRTQNVPVGAGENSGRVLPHRNVVRQLARLGSWHGQAADFSLPAATTSGLDSAVLIQDGAGGAIIAASVQPR